MLGWVKDKIASELERIKGAIFVEAGEADARIKICERCENFKSISRRCKLCGCFMDAKTKLKIIPGDPSGKPVKCPAEKW